MEKLVRSLVALDLSDTDQAVLKFTASIIEPMNIGSIYVLHVMPSFTAPKQLDVEFHKLFNPAYPVDEKVKNQLLQDLQSAVKGLPYLDLQIDILEGQPYEKLLHWLEVKEIDLLILGHKKQSLGSGITGKRTVRNAKAAVLYVPENPPGAIKNILVPVDFSEQSARALEKALTIADELPGCEVTALHIVDQPSAIFYDPAWESSPFQRVLQDSAVDSYNRFISSHGFPGKSIKSVFTDNELNSISKHILEQAKEQSSSLIILGAKGHSALNNLVFGSVAESLVERCKDIPMLVVR